MKIKPSNLRINPKTSEYNFYVYDTPNENVADWISYHKLKTEFVDRNTYIRIDDISDKFEYKTYEYCDGFSPNINKEDFHLGDLANLVIAKSFQSLGIAKQFNALLGDVGIDIKDKEKAVKNYIDFCNEFGYYPDIHLASEQNVEQIPLYDGEYQYLGAKVFHTGDDRVVGIKSNGTATYFYQNVAFTEKYPNQLYVTYKNFDNLKKLFVDMEFIQIGNIIFPTSKMVPLQRMDNMEYAHFDKKLITIENFMESFKEFKKETIYNIFIANILNYNLTKKKSIIFGDLKNVKTSIGLQLCIALVRLKKAGFQYTNTFSIMANYNHLLTIEKLSPNILLKYLQELCKKIYKIKDIENKQLFQPMYDDLYRGMELLGFFDIDEV